MCDELGVKTVETPHHCWKDDRIKELEPLELRLTRSLSEEIGLRGRIKVLEARLKRYGRHDGEASLANNPPCALLTDDLGCRTGCPCSCGLDCALAGEEPQNAAGNPHVYRGCPHCGSACVSAKHDALCSCGSVWPCQLAGKEENGG